ncbi:MAG TPA: serine acetyltransferase [Flavobacterium sp.]|nr:serine acetyltransferase [Flavobacterium sp.]
MADSAKYLIEQDLVRYGRIKKFGLRVFFKYVFIEVIPGIKFSVIFRLCQHYRYKNKLIFYFFFLWLRRLKYKYGFDISYRTKIGKGLYIGHFGGIVIHGDTEIGENCNLSQGMTIGILNRGKSAGTPKIGDRVFIGPSAVILGGITVGNDVLIGANAVVNFDVPDNAVVAAPMATVISGKGSADYVTDLT